MTTTTTTWKIWWWPWLEGLKEWWMRGSGWTAVCGCRAKSPRGSDGKTSASIEPEQQPDLASVVNYQCKPFSLIPHSVLLLRWFSCRLHLLRVRFWSWLASVFSTCVAFARSFCSIIYRPTDFSANALIQRRKRVSGMDWCCNWLLLNARISLEDLLSDAFRWLMRNEQF